MSTLQDRTSRGSAKRYEQHDEARSLYQSCFSSAARCTLRWRVTKIVTIASEMSCFRALAHTRHALGTKQSGERRFVLTYLLNCKIIDCVGSLFLAEVARDICIHKFPSVYQANVRTPVTALTQTNRTASSMSLYYIFILNYITAAQALAT
jgi:hypothetical protein